MRSRVLAKRFENLLVEGGKGLVESARMSAQVDKSGVCSSEKRESTETVFEPGRHTGDSDAGGREVSLVEAGRATGSEDDGGIAGGVRAVREMSRQR